MLSCRLVLPLVLLVFAASGCRTDISGVMSINEAAAFCDDPSITWFPVEEALENYWHEVSELEANKEVGAINSPPNPDRGNFFRFGELQGIDFDSDLENEIRLQSEYIGLTANQAYFLALRQGRTFRLGDGPMTAEYVSGRITARTKDGIVQTVSIED